MDKYCVSAALIVGIQSPSAHILHPGSIMLCVSVSVCQVSAVRLFFTPENENDDPPNQAKRHFLQTGESLFYDLQFSQKR